MPLITRAFFHVSRCGKKGRVVTRDGRGSICCHSIKAALSMARMALFYGQINECELENLEETILKSGLPEDLQEEDIEEFQKFLKTAMVRRPDLFENRTGGKFVAD